VIVSVRKLNFELGEATNLGPGLIAGMAWINQASGGDGGWRMAG